MTSPAADNQRDPTDGGATTNPLSPWIWAVLLAAGQAATLQWVAAGPRIGYQHYLPWSDLFGQIPAWTIGVVAIQLVAVAATMARRRSEGRSWPAGGWRWWVIALVFVLTSATLSREPLRYGGELMLATAVQLLHLATLLCFVASLSNDHLAWIRRLADRWLGPAGTTAAEPGGLDRFVWILAVAVVVTAALLATFSYQRHPHVPDEVVYLLQARYQAAGMLDLPLPPVAEAFNVDLMTYQSTRWFSPVPPGWPFLLTIGAFFGAAWLVNPVLGGVNILLAYLLTRELYPRRTARVVVLLLAVSPWHLFMSMNLMTHTATLTAALGAAAAVGRLRRDPRLRWAVLAGVGIGIVGLIRPLEGMAVAMVLGLWSLGARGRRIRLLPSAAMTVVAIGVGALVLPYNRYLTGSARTFPIMAYTDAVYGPGTNALGFGPNRGLPWPGLDPLPGHGAPDVLINANMNLFQINTELHGWATGSLVLILVMAGWGRWRRPDWAMAGVVAVVAGLHSFYYFSGGPDFGARYWYLVLLPCLVLSARGLETAEAGHGAPAPGDTRPLAAVLLLLLVTTVVFVPWRAIDKYRHYRGMRPEPRALAADPAMAGAIILIRGHRHPDYASAAVYNPLRWTDPAPIFAWDRGDAVRRQLVETWPDRPFWIVEGPTVSGRGFVVTAGPLTGDSLLARTDSIIPWP